MTDAVGVGNGGLALVWAFGHCDGLDGPVVTVARKALETGSIEQVVKLLTDAMRNGVHKHFDAALGRRQFAPDDVEAGRAYVEAYVPYVHYVERLWQAAQGAAHAHGQHHAGHGH